MIFLLHEHKIARALLILDKACDIIVSCEWQCGSFRHKS